jgi:hypothetical protein
MMREGLFREGEQAMRAVHFLGRGGLVCCLILSGISLVRAADPQERVERRREAGRINAHERRFRTIMGANVVIHDNVAIGKVDDLVLGDDGCIDYMVVTERDRYVLVPWSAARIDFASRGVTIEIREDRFREVPTFTRERWPDLSDSRYVERLYTYYGVKPRPKVEKREERREDRKEDRKEDRRR